MNNNNKYRQSPSREKMELIEKIEAALGREVTISQLKAIDSDGDVFVLIHGLKWFESAHAQRYIEHWVKYYYSDFKEKATYNKSYFFGATATEIANMLDIVRKHLELKRCLFDLEISMLEATRNLDQLKRNYSETPKYVELLEYQYNEHLSNADTFLIM